MMPSESTPRIKPRTTRVAKTRSRIIRVRKPPRLPRRRHDRTRRKLFTHRRTVLDLLRGFLRADWIRDIDPSSLRKLPTDYVTRHLAERIGDVVWEVKTRGKSFYVLIVIEFQSRQDPFMAVRMLLYVALCYEMLIKHLGLGKGDKLPAVLPFLFYNGGGDYDAPLEISELIAAVPPEILRYQPSMRHLLIDEQRYPVERFENLDNVVGKLLRLQQSGPDEMRQIVREELDWLEESDPALMEDLLEWIEVGLLPDRQKDTPIPQLETLDELKTYMEMDMESWNDMLLNRGRSEGRTKGRADVVLSQIEEKFGGMNDALTARIQSADSEHLLEWARRILTAQRLEEVFGDA